MKALCLISGVIQSQFNQIISVLLLVLCFGLSNCAANSSSEVIPPANCDTYGMEIVSRKVIEKSGEMQCVVTLEIRGDCNGGWSASDFDLKLKDVHMAEPEQYPDMKRGMVQRPSSQSYTFGVLLLGDKSGTRPGNQSFKIKKKKIAILKDFKKPYRIKFQSGRLDVGYYSAD